MRTHINALRDNVLVSIEAAKAKKIGDIHLPDTTNGFSGQGIVAFVGPLVKGIRVKDRVAIPNTHGGSKLTVQGVEYICFKADQIIAKLTEVD